VSSRSRSARIDRSLRLALIAILIPWYAADLGSDATTHGDETYWTAAGFTMATLVWVERDLFAPFWTGAATVPVLENRDLSAAAVRNPKLGALLVGTSILVSGTPAPAWTLYRFDKSAAWNRERGNLPSPATLVAGRLPIAAFGVLGALFFFSLLRTQIPPALAFAGALLLACNPLVHLVYRRAMLDGPAFALSIGAVLFTVRACRDPGRTRLFLAVAALGCAAVSCKLNAGILLPAMGLAIALESALRRRAAPLLRALAAGVAALVVFVLLNPTLYPAPASGLVAMLALGGEMQGLPAFFPMDALPDVTSRASAAYDLVLFRFGMINALVSLPIDGVLLAAGAVILAGRARGSASARVLLCWLAAAGLAVCLWPPVRWDRYFLPALAPVFAVECVAMSALAMALWRRARRFLRDRSAPAAVGDSPGA
jgi:hypothetical protein